MGSEQNRLILFGTGKNASIEEFPFMVQISINEKVFCGGCIISQLFILTAAHCFFYGRRKLPASALHIIAGESETGAGSRRTIRDFIIHPDYDPETLENDIAIITLEKKLTFDIKIGKLDLALHDNYNKVYKSKATVLGWGNTERPEENRQPVQAKTLQKAKIRIQPDDYCSEDEDYKVHWKDGHICAGLFGRGAIACNGDSGSPLVCEEKKNSGHSVVCGIVSFGFNNCESQPVIFTKVYHHIQWIANNAPGVLKTITRTAPTWTSTISSIPWTYVSSTLPPQPQQPNNNQNIQTLDGNYAACEKYVGYNCQNECQYRGNNCWKFKFNYYPQCYQTLCNCYSSNIC